MSQMNEKRANDLENDVEYRYDTFNKTSTLIVNKGAVNMSKGVLNGAKFKVEFGKEITEKGANEITTIVRNTQLNVFIYLFQQIFKS